MAVNEGGDMIPIGALIKEELARQGRSVTWLARNIPCDRAGLYRVFGKNSIDTQMLVRISELLGRDFFKLYSEAVGQKDCRTLPTDLSR